MLTIKRVIELAEIGARSNLGPHPGSLPSEQEDACIEELGAMIEILRYGRKHGFNRAIWERTVIKKDDK